MIRTTLVCLFVVLLCAPLVAQDDPAEPQDLGTSEEVEVNLAMIETLVLDGKGNPVQGLTKEDFELTIDGVAHDIDVLDVNCPAEGQPTARERLGLPPLPRRFVFVIDYYHLGYAERGETVGRTAALLFQGMQPQDEIMIVALANGLRIEQGFTRDKNEIMTTIERMYHDASLFAGQFDPLTNRAFFDGMKGLMAVLAGYEGPKAMILFSNWNGPSDQEDIWMIETAQRATFSRTVIYPQYAAGLQAGSPAGTSPVLARLANESGGRMPMIALNDLSGAWKTARHDLACRYAVGFYLEPDETYKSSRIAVYVRKDGNHEVRFPEIFKMWPADQIRQAKIAAAFMDPVNYADADVRMSAWPLSPAGTKKWDTLAVLTYPVDASRDVREVGITMARGTTKVETFNRTVTVPAAKDGEAIPRTVTIYGDAPLKPGDYSMTVVLSKPDSDKLRTTRMAFTVPEVPADTIVLNGPIMAHVNDGGVRVQVGDDKKGLDDVISEGSFEPLLVHRVERGETVIALTSICGVGKLGDTSALTIHRQLFDAEGKVVEALDPIPLMLEPKGKKGKAVCHELRESYVVDDLAAGNYFYSISVQGGDGAVPAGQLSFGVYEN